MIARVMIIIVGFSNSTRACQSVIFNSPWGNSPLIYKIQSEHLLLLELVARPPKLAHEEPEPQVILPDVHGHLRRGEHRAPQHEVLLGPKHLHPAEREKRPEPHPRHAPAQETRHQLLTEAQGHQVRQNDRRHHEEHGRLDPKLVVKRVRVERAPGFVRDNREPVGVERQIFTVEEGRPVLD